MNNLYMTIINCLLCYTTLFLSYLLALAFIGVSLPVKQVLLPILLFSIIAYISKASLHASASVHTVVVVITCAGLLYLFNKTNIILSLIGSLLSFTTLTLGSLLLACPVLAQLGYAIPSKFNGLVGILLALLELVVPTLILVILQITKFSLMKYISMTR